MSIDPLQTVKDILGFSVPVVSNPVTATGDAVQSAKDAVGSLNPFAGMTAPNKGSGKTPVGFGPWLVAMTALAGVLLLMSDSDKWQPVGTALAAVIAVTVAFKWGKPAMYEVDAVFGTTFISKKA